MRASPAPPVSRGCGGVPVGAHGVHALGGRKGGGRPVFCARCAHWVWLGAPGVLARSGMAFGASRVAFLWYPACRARAVLVI